MAFKLCVIFLVLACASSIFAQNIQNLLYKPNEPIKPQTLPFNPQHRPTIQTLPYTPRRSSSSPILRVRRQLGGQVSTNPNGGLDAKIQAGHAIGTPNHNLAAGVFAAGNTAGGPVSTGGRAEYNIGGHQLSLTKVHTPGVSDVLTQGAKVNLFANDRNTLDANAFKSQNTLANGFQFQKTGGSLDWNNVNGHGANVGMSRIPNFGTTFDVGAKANLWRSQDKLTTLDMFGGASRTVGGPFNGQSNFGGGLRMTSIFG